MSKKLSRTDKNVRLAIIILFCMLSAWAGTEIAKWAN